MSLAHPYPYRQPLRFGGARARLLLGAALGLSLAPGAARAAVTEVQLGLGALTSYNTQVLPPISSKNLETNETTSTNGAPGLNLAVTPWLNLSVDTGRIAQSLRLMALVGADVFVAGVPEGSDRAAPSYQGTLASITRFALSARLTWDLLVNGSVGTINSYTQLQNPSTQRIEGINLRALSSFNVGAGSSLAWEPTARLKVTQVISFRSFIPFGEVKDEQGVNQSATSSLQSYNLDGGVGVDHQWARLSLGGELRLGWFLPQRGISPTAGLENDQSVIIGQLLGRFTWDLTPRWHAEGNAGVFVATQGSHFLEGERMVPDPNKATATRPVNSTLASPVGSLLFGYTFPRVEAGLSLAYQHGAAGEVVLGRMTISDAVTLRAFLPLPRNLVLSASGGYRYAAVAENGGLTTAPVRNRDTGEVTNPAYHMALADAALTWLPRPGLQLSLRGGVVVQRFVRDEPTAATGATQAVDNTLLDFTRGIVTLGLAYVYPQR